MKPSEFDVIDSKLEYLARGQDHQGEDIGKIFDKVEAQGIKIAKIETRLEDIVDIKVKVDENSRWISIIRGVGIAATVVYGSLLALLGFRQ